MTIPEIRLGRRDQLDTAFFGPVAIVTAADERRVHRQDVQAVRENQEEEE